VRQLLPNALEVNVDYPRQASAEATAASHRSLQPGELFAKFYQAKNGAQPGEDLRKLFEDVYDEAHG
jgi:hypothetical protein